MLSITITGETAAGKTVLAMATVPRLLEMGYRVELHDDYRPVEYFGDSEWPLAEIRTQLRLPIDDGSSERGVARQRELTQTFANNL